MRCTLMCEDRARVLHTDTCINTVGLAESLSEARELLVVAEKVGADSLSHPYV